MDLDTEAAVATWREEDTVAADNMVITAMHAVVAVDAVAATVVDTAVGMVVDTDIGNYECSDADDKRRRSSQTPPPKYFGVGCDSHTAVAHLLLQVNRFAAVDCGIHAIDESPS
jgi:hypothetical protein